MNALFKFLEKYLNHSVKQETGSGKTYSLTGSHTKYNNRGLIPRTIEYIFSLITKSLNNYIIYISYLEIYNEVAYDLLNPKENVTTLEELPRVLLLEDNKGEAHFKNLSVRSVCSEEEAMRLLFLGDTNRTIAETPLNEYSSRSHCIFTVHVTSRNHESEKIRKSKLNLVDLAGSERLHKMNLNGVTLNEAKYINLSLHYLEQVILAISESRRAHIPYRNSIMTFMLRDSISGNCLTAMLATLAITKYNIEETISTCKFAQRVSMVKTDVMINEETDPQQEISILRNEILELRKRLAEKSDLQVLSKLTKEEEDECRAMVKNYIYGSEELPFGDLRKVKFYIELLKEQIQKKLKIKAVATNGLPSEAEQKYKQIIKQKDEEISILMNIFNNKMEEAKLAIPSYKSQESQDNLIREEKMATLDKPTFDNFLSKTENKKTLSFYSGTLEEKYKLAAAISRQLAEEQNKIISIRSDIETNCTSFDSLEQLSFKLKSEQNIYRELLLKLQNVKSEIEYLKHGMAHTKVKLFDDFKKWLLNRNGIHSKATDVLVENNLIQEERTNFEVRKANLLNYGPAAPAPHYDAFSQSSLPKIYEKPPREHKSSAFDINAELDELFNKSLAYNIGDFKSISYPSGFGHKQSLVSPRCKVMFSQKMQKPVRDVDYADEKLEKLLSSAFGSEEKSTLVDSRSLESMRPTKDNDFLNFNISGQSSYDYISPRPPSSVKNAIKTKPPDESPRSVSASTNSSHMISPNFSESSLGLYNLDDGVDFMDFMKTVPLTGDRDVDEEIVKFYRIKFKT